MFRKFPCIEELLPFHQYFIDNFCFNINICIQLNHFENVFIQKSSRSRCIEFHKFTFNVITSFIHIINKI